jgi:hypothetical protein
MGDVPNRRGKALFLTVDYDAIPLLEAMVPHPRGRGPLVSEMIRREARERASRDGLIDALVYARKKVAEQ